MAAPRLIVGLVLLSLAVAAAPADLVLTGRLHHLRLGPAREWSDFPAEAEGPSLVLRFDGASNARERTLRLRHRDVKAAWRVRLNDVELARLAADEADTVSFLAVPRGTLKAGANELRIDGPANAVDDVMIGEIRLLDAPRSAVVSDATVDLTVRDAATGRPMPSRLTVTDEAGALVALGTASDATHAVRPGVVYTATGTARVQLPAGRYVIHAGRGFEYGVARIAVDLASGQRVAHRLTIRREVDTRGWAAMDTHVHTATFARHGDATIAERMITLAGEGIELPVSTEHDTRVDLASPARAAGALRWFTPILGTEVTTPALGHFNVFPLAASGGALDRRTAGWSQLATAVDTLPGAPVVVLNHGRDVHGGFRPLDPSRHIGIAGEDLDGWRLPATAMEIVNSGAVMSDALALTRDWFGFLNRGVRVTPVGSSDSHDVARYIVGQGRTYVRVDDRRPDALDRDAAIASVRRGAVSVSYGLLTEIEISGRGPGDLVPARGPLAVRIRVKGPGWTRVDRVALYANGVRVREEAISGGNAAGIKWQSTWRLPTPSHDLHLVAVATGPGVTAAYWPMAKPYQPTSPEFTPYVLGVSGAVFVDGDGTGTFESAIDYARRELAAAPEPSQLAARLDRYDAAVAIQGASLLRARDPATFDSAIAAMLSTASPPVARGLRDYVDAWRASGR